MLPIFNPIVPLLIPTTFPGTFWRERTSQADNLFFVNFDGATWEWCNIGTGSDDDVLRFNIGLTTFNPLSCTEIMVGDMKEAVLLI